MQTSKVKHLLETFKAQGVKKFKINSIDDKTLKGISVEFFPAKEELKLMDAMPTGERPPTEQELLFMSSEGLPEKDDE